MIKMRRTGAWGTAASVMSKMASKLAQATDMALLEEGHFYRAQIIKGIDAGAPGGEPLLPLSATTLATRSYAGFSGTKPLIRTASMRNAVTVVKKGKAVFVGILRTATNGSKPLIDIAELQEFGGPTTTVPLTAKSRRHLFGILRHGGLLSPGGAGSSSGTVVFTIPARPFIRPVFAKYGGQVGAKRFAETVWRKLVQLGGVPGSSGGSGGGGGGGGPRARDAQGRFLKSGASPT